MKRSAAIAFIPLVSLAADCSGCHPRQAAAFATSGHKHSLRRVTPGEPIAGLKFAERDGTSYDYGRLPLVTIRRGTESLEAPLEWAFGNGKYGVTYVGRYDNRWFEHRFTSFTDTRKPDYTPGHTRSPALTVRDTLGLFQSPADATRCFNCHAANVKPGPDLSAMVPGVTCERCHGSGDAHAAAPTAKNVLNPGRFPAKQVVQICGECHRTPGTNFSSEPELDDPMSVRFQPVGLMASACFQKSGKLSCLTCHDPHATVSRDVSAYDAKCSGCHSVPADKSKAPCPRTPNCASCHMPRSNPAPHLTFTDHRIRRF